MKLKSIMDRAKALRQLPEHVRTMDEVEFYREVLHDIAIGKGNPSAKAHAALEARGDDE
jgi:hypothetical protein